MPRRASLAHTQWRLAPDGPSGEHRIWQQSILGEVFPNLARELSFLWMVGLTPTIQRVINARFAQGSRDWSPISLVLILRHAAEVEPLRELRRGQASALLKSCGGSVFGIPRISIQLGHAR